MDNTRIKYYDYNVKDAVDYEGRLKDSFFKYIKRTKNYDRNEVPWEENRGSKPVQIQMSAYLRKILLTKLYISITKLIYTLIFYIHKINKDIRDLQFIDLRITFSD